MIAVQHVQTSLPVEQGQEGKNVPMCFNNLFHAAVFPEFVSVPQFNISITGAVIMLQGGVIQILVLQKIVVGGTNTPMAVTEQDIFCTVIQRESGHVLK